MNPVLKRKKVYFQTELITWQFKHFFAESPQVVQRQDFSCDLNHKRHQKIIIGSLIYKVSAFEICGKPTRQHKATL